MKRIENSTNGSPRFQFNAKLVSELSETILQNSNGKNYKLCTVEFTNAKGREVTANAAIYEGNYSKTTMEVGKSYLCTATIVTTLTPQGEEKKIPYLQLSHLIAGAGFADADDFDLDEEFVDVETGEVTMSNPAS
jgi:adenine-specific DNA methylase